MTTRRRGGTNALACQVTIYRRESYVAVKFVLKNVREEPVSIAYRQTVPGDLTRDHLSFTSGYMGDSWAFEDATLEFTATVDSMEQIETVYGIKRVEIPALVDFINYGTIVVTQDGTTIETLTGIDPDIEGEPDETDETADAETPSSDETPTESSAGTATGAPASDDPQTSDKQEPGAAQQPSHEESQQEPEQTADASRVAADDESTEDSDNSVEWVTPTPADSAESDEVSAQTEESDTTDSTGAAEALDEPDAGTNTAAAGTGSQKTGRDASDSGETGDDRRHVPFSAEETAGSDGKRRPALPANPEDYILEDVRGKIESTAEFEWVDIAVDATEEEDGGVLEWVRSRLPF
ncbi:hypothetical protein [Halovenus salina]|uniref:Uncharacterized protein n=1 Tax=Halovenus salina TaxID=1510225 RepID=A0ABD5W382_9EURY|nr:hypothetical protein [Halovenus salina]